MGGYQVSKIGLQADQKKFSNALPHRIIISERESMAVDGVTNVESFDDQEVVLNTSAGILIVKGRDLHIKQLNLDDGNVAIEGFVDGFEYEEDRETRKGKGFFGRLLK
jgi:sporulation protein YabP